MNLFGYRVWCHAACLPWKIEPLSENPHMTYTYPVKKILIVNYAYVRPSLTDNVMEISENPHMTYTYPVKKKFGQPYIFGLW
jgi:hypothetical protein